MRVELVRIGNSPGIRIPEYAKTYVTWRMDWPEVLDS